MNKKEKFIKKCNEKFGDKYDYSKSNYFNSINDIEIKCNIHNEYFFQRPAEHLRGKNGCNFCSKNPKVDTNFFVNKAKLIHGNRYDYTKTKYINSKTKIKIICKKHGEFEQLPNNHYIQNCPECHNESRYLNNFEFIEKANKIHDEKYDYDSIDYKKSKDKIFIICKEHGKFEQKPNDHLSGKGCPKCGDKYNINEGEVKNFIEKVGIKLEKNIKNIISPFELDIYIPDKKIAIEYNGLYWHSELYKSDNYHLNKTELCEKQGIQLIHIFEDEWLYKREIVESRLKNILGLTKERVFARKCEIKEVNNKESREFLNKNHIQGNVGSSLKIGLYYNNELVSIMTFGDLRRLMGKNKENDSYELLRFCNKLDTTVIGGANKLLKYFIKTHKPKEIISYADRRWSQGNLYEKLDFTFIHNSKPNYYYIMKDKREYRFKYRKDVLVREGYDKDKTERQIMKERGINRIYDCGNKKWLMKL
jgi:hypothetical protein